MTKTIYKITNLINGKIYILVKPKIFIDVC